MQEWWLRGVGKSKDFFTTRIKTETTKITDSNTVAFCSQSNIHILTNKNIAYQDRDNKWHYQIHTQTDSKLRGKYWRLHPKIYSGTDSSSSQSTIQNLGTSSLVVLIKLATMSGPNEGAMESLTTTTTNEPAVKQITSKTIVLFKQNTQPQSIISEGTMRKHKVKIPPLSWIKNLKCYCNQSSNKI